MKQSFLILFFAWPVLLYSQESVKEFTASNGVTYQQGDTITLGQGSAQDGGYLFLQIEAGTTSNQSGNNVQHVSVNYPESYVIVQEIKTYTDRGAEKVCFTVGDGNSSPHKLLIEEAIKACEVNPCTVKVQARGTLIKDPLERLQKLMDKRDEGEITDEDYEIMKANILKDI